ncbi:hypothetical protein OROHE_023983 [Orobanche hederae]
MEKSVMVVGLDDSDCSFYALEWTLQHFFLSTPPETPLFKLVVVHAKPSPVSAVGLVGPVLPERTANGQRLRSLVLINEGRLFQTSSLDYIIEPEEKGTADVIPYVDADLKKIAARVLDKAKETCTAKSVKDVTFEVVDGDARNVLCEAVEKHHASVFVVGSHGYGAIKRAVLGSVSDYCAHHAHSSVMIVKRPKIKH